MGKNDNAAPLPKINQQLFKEGGWKVYAATIDLDKAVKIWACKTEVKGIGNAKFNLEWLLPRHREGIGGRGELP